LLNSKFNGAEAGIRAMPGSDFVATVGKTLTLHSDENELDKEKAWNCRQSTLISSQC
jgi:hypothetical protein